MTTGKKCHVVTLESMETIHDVSIFLQILIKICGYFVHASTSIFPSSKESNIWQRFGILGRNWSHFWRESRRWNSGLLKCSSTYAVILTSWSVVVYLRLDTPFGAKRQFNQTIKDIISEVILYGFSERSHFWVMIMCWFLLYLSTIFITWISVQLFYFYLEILSQKEIKSK